MKKLTGFLLILCVSSSIAHAGGVPPFTTPLWRTFIDGLKAEFQADSDSTTFFQVKDASGTVIFTIDTTNGNTFIGDGGDSDYVKIDKQGHMTFIGHAGVPYGSMYLHEGAVNIDISAAGQGTYVKVTGLTAGQYHDVTLNSDAFNVDQIGVYKVTWSLSGDSQGNNKIYEVDLFVNGVEQSDGSAREEFGAIGSLSSFGSSAIIPIYDTTHDIDLRMKEPGGGGGTDFDIFHASFNIFQLAGSSAIAPENVIYAGEDVIYAAEQVVYP